MNTPYKSINPSHIPPSKHQLRHPNTQYLNINHRRNHIQYYSNKKKKQSFQQKNAHEQDRESMTQEIHDKYHGRSEDENMNKVKHSIEVVDIEKDDRDVKESWGVKIGMVLLLIAGGIFLFLSERWKGGRRSQVVSKVEKRMREADEMFRYGGYRRAVDMYLALLESEELDSGEVGLCYLGISKCYFQMGEYELALKYLGYADNEIEDPSLISFIKKYKVLLENSNE